MKTNAITFHKMQQLHLFSKSRDCEEIFATYGNHPLFQKILSSTEQFHEIVHELTSIVPHYDLEQNTNGKSHYEKVKSLIHRTNNVIHVPFEQLKQAPFIIVIQERNESLMDLLKIQIMPFIELAIMEKKDVIVVAGSQKPLIIRNGVCTKRFIEQYLTLHANDLDELPVNSFKIQHVFQRESELLLVNLSDQSNPYSEEQIEKLEDYKRLFDCVIRGFYAKGEQIVGLSHILDEVYFMDDLQLS